MLGGGRGPGLNTYLSQGSALHGTGPETRAWPDRQDGPRLSGEEAAPGASRKTFLFQQQHGVTAWLHVTACPQRTVPAHLEGFPRDWAPPWSSQPPVPPCSAFPGGRGGRSLGQPRGPRGGWPGAWVVTLQQARLRGLPPRSPHSLVVWSSGGERGRRG